MKPLISVIVPVYNVEDYLCKCVDSILAQSYKRIEIILVDDGSTDGSPVIADNYAKKYKNIKVIHKKNGGLSSARNAGMKIASGEWLSFIDSDDYVEPDFISELFKLTRNNDPRIGITTCSFQGFSYDGSTPKSPAVWLEKEMTGVEALDDLFKNKRRANVCFSLTRSCLFKEHGIEFPEGQEYEDVFPRIRLLYYSDKVSFTNKRLYNYLSRKNSITGESFSESKYRDFMTTINNVESFLASEGFIERSEFFNYFKYYMCFSQLNYLARIDASETQKTKKIWKSVRTDLNCMRKNVSFPTKKKKIIYDALFILSSSRRLYSFFYRKAKK